MTAEDDLYQIADELRAVASAGLRFADHGYDKERYEKILRASARLVALVAHQSFEDIYSQYTDNLAHLSPLLCVESVVFRDGKILLIRRHDDGLWAVPGGLAEVGETLAQAAERELWEEAGVRGKASRLLALLDSRLWNSRSRMHLCIAQFLMESDDEPVLHANENAHSSFSEALDVGFFAEQELPELSKGHDLRVPALFKMIRGEIDTPYFDH